MLDFAAAIFFGNALTLCFVWGMVQFYRHDFKAPWVAYAAVMFPMLFLAASAYLTEGRLPPLYALGLQ